MGKLTRKRKIAYAFAVVLLVLFFLVAAVPLWFPWVLRPVLEKQGIRYTHYERNGYGRFVLNDVRFSQAKMKLEARRVAVLLPNTLLWRLLREDAGENYLQVSDWNLQLLETGKEEKAVASVYRSVEKLDPVLAQLNRWLPKAALTNGVIHVRNKEISIPDAAWKNGNLTARVVSNKLLPETTFAAQFAKTAMQISWKTAAWNLESELIAHQDKQALKIEGSVMWQSNRVEIAAQFGHNDLLPQSASLQSKSFRVPTELVKFEGYRDLTGSMDIRWQTNRFSVDLTAEAEPMENPENYLSPVEMEIRASGDTNSFRIESANISSPWLQGKLSRNVEFNFRGEMMSPVATLSISGDLSRQKWFPARGQIRGEAILKPGQNRFPDTTFDLSGAAIEVGRLQTEQLDLRGKFEWPWLGIQSATVQFKDGGTAQGNLRFDAVSRQVSDGRVAFAGQIGQQFLPRNISYKNISLLAQFSGPLTNLAHSAHLEVQEVKFANVVPLGIIGDWDGTGQSLQNFQAKVLAKNSSLVLSGSLEAETNHFTAHLQSLVLLTNAVSLLHLENAFAISWTGVGSNRVVGIEPLLWRGEKTGLSLSGEIQWPHQGTVAATVKDFDFAPFQDFSEGPLPDALIERINLSAHWTNGPLTFLVDGLARFTSEDGTLFSAEVRAGGDGNGVSIERASVGDGREAVISGKGFLPVRINPATRSNVVQTLPKQRIDFQAATTPNPQFWERVSQWTHTTFQEPSGSIAVTGTLDSPSGKVVLAAKEILFKPGKADQPLPRVQNLVADFDLVRDHIALHRFEVLVEGQPVTATGELPLPDNLETNWKKIFDWRKANVHLKMVDAQIAPFEHLFPKFLSPLGTFNLDLTAAGGKLEGELRVLGAALRPIPSLGPVHDIEARVKLLGDEVKLETFKESIGGQPVELAGEIGLAKEKGALPPFDLKLRGTNVPLAREPELILRSDIDLSFSNKKGGPPLVSGTLNLRDSFYLSELKRLIPGKVAKAKQRPPFFSVETEPFAGWRLDVAVRGTNFFKVRSPLFHGELSSNLKIEGTLKEPMALGDVTIASGVVQFPFANLRVIQGFVSLTSENPYRPQLVVSASGRIFGYEVKMDLSGSADKPNVEFSSNPGLTSEQILLMITAGELPHDEINFSTQQKAGRLAFFLGKSLYSKFGGSAESKLEIRSGDDVSEQGRQTYFLEYKLTKDWSIVGEYDRFGGVNAGVKWIFFSK